MQSAERQILKILNSSGCLELIIFNAFKITQQNKITTEIDKKKLLIKSLFP